MKKVAYFAVVALFATSVAMAGSWAESGDAIDLLPGQETVGTGSLDMITGSIGVPDVDLYHIKIVDYMNFSASTVGLVSWDSRLFLFNSTGYGVVMDDDDAVSGTLQSKITSAYIPGNGDYYLAIARYNSNALDANGQEIWLSSPYTEKTPDGPGAANPLASWSYTTNTAGDYSIALTGAAFGVPEPASLVLLAVAGLVLRRR